MSSHLNVSESTPLTNDDVITTRYSKTTGFILRPPTRTELQACWELCRLHNNIGFWVVWLPTGKSVVWILYFYADMLYLHIAWSIAMVYRAQAELSWVDAVSRAAIYIPLCFGIKSLVSTHHSFWPTAMLNLDP